MANYGPYGPNIVAGSNSGAGAYDISGFPNSATSPSISPLINTEIVKKSFPTMVQYLLPKGDSTLFGLTAKLKEETAVQIEHGFFSKVMVFPTFQITAAVAGSAVPYSSSTFTVSNAAQALVNGLYRWVGTVNTGTGNTLSAVDTAMTGEIVLVTSSTGNGGTSITVTRGIGYTGATLPSSGIANGGLFVHIGNAFADASTRPNSFLTQEIRVINYTQIFRNAWSISGTVAAIQNLIGDTNIGKSRKECSQYHAMDIEKSFLFGQRSNVVGVLGTNYASRTMNGVIAQITDAGASSPQAAGLFLPGAGSGSQNIQTASSINANVSTSVGTAGCLNMNDFENWANNIFDMAYDPQSGMERILFVGRASHTVLNRLFRANVTYFVERATEWGLRYTSAKLTRGDLMIIEHPLLNTNPAWQMLAIAIDLPAISVAYLTGRKTKAEEYNQNGIAIDQAIDAQGGSLLTEVTILCKNPSGCGVLTNIQTAIGPAQVPVS